MTRRFGFALVCWSVFLLARLLKKVTDTFSGSAWFSRDRWKWTNSLHTQLIHKKRGTLFLTIIIHAGVGRAFSHVCLFACRSVCPCSKRKTAWAVNTKLGIHILWSSRSACIDPEVKVTRLQITSRSHGCYWHVLLLPAWVCMSIRLPMFSSSHISWWIFYIFCTSANGKEYCTI